MGVTDAAKLPGAFLFLKVTDTSDNIYYSLAYDETITPGMTLAQLRAKYLPEGGPKLPYNERFAGPFTAANDSQVVWDSAQDVSYGGIFGLKKGPFSPTWPYNSTNGKPIEKGVYISFWNFSEKARGIHTSSISQVFDPNAKVPYMKLFKGSTKNLIPSTATALALKSVVVNYYATFQNHPAAPGLGAGDLNWVKDNTI